MGSITHHPSHRTHQAKTVGAITFGVSVIAAIAASSAPETYRVRMTDLVNANAAPLGKAEYDRLRGRSVADAKAGAMAA